LAFCWSQSTWMANLYLILASGQFIFHFVFALACLALRLAFRDNYIKTNKDRPITVCRKMYFRDCSFWQYKFYADICGVSLERRHQMIVGGQFSVLSIAVPAEASFWERCVKTKMLVYCLQHKCLTAMLVSGSKDSWVYSRWFSVNKTSNNSGCFRPTAPVLRRCMVAANFC